MLIQLKFYDTLLVCITRTYTIVRAIFVREKGFLLSNKTRKQANIHFTLWCPTTVSAHLHYFTYSELLKIA